LGTDRATRAIGTRDVGRAADEVLVQLAAGTARDVANPAERSAAAMPCASRNAEARALARSSSARVLPRVVIDHAT
jgi:hypothetical protein